jgi:hypothetical protein
MDMAVGRQIQQSYQRIAQTYQHLQQGAQWVQGRCNENKTRYARAKACFWCVGEGHLRRNGNFDPVCKGYRIRFLMCVRGAFCG